MTDAAIRAVIDTDPGIDDAVAILYALASPAFDIVGLTTVAGNIGIETTTRNAGRILALAARSDIPVVAGASAPLSRTGFDSAEIHGDDGLGGVGFPEPLVPARGDAVTWLAEQLEAAPIGTLDILALGPLTNIALLLRDRPSAARRIRRLIVMGGAIHEPGNVGPRSEFNIAADPEAAELVFSAGLPTVLIPLDVTRKVRADRGYLDALRARDTAAAAASANLIEAYFQSASGGESRPLHDPCVMLFAENPALFSTEDIRIAVDTGVGSDAGALLAGESGGPAVSVALGVDAPAALELLAARLGVSAG
ncbi:nucleoside hydrolase [Aquamicrobium sp. LC103]|uniref:nucleoside hydrolase n=1 Tax=Aquamicrobium sp. LC103 TaxID=1120658 RepID=UPI00063EAE14|nr:nucleoside hydrolase [Aquamicrobium sp. LC103]TKT76233.1 nucleoside hydrolase [Aquamicrobium sp. LC103]